MALASWCVLFLQHAAQSTQADGVSVAVATPAGGPGSLSPGAWNAIIVFGVMLAAVFLSVGATLADSRNLKKNTEKDVGDIRAGVGRDLTSMKETLDSILAAQREGLMRQIEDAGWRAEIAGLVRDATKTAEHALDTAHKLRNILQAFEPRIASLEEERERREELERRIGPPDRRG